MNDTRRKEAAPVLVTGVAGMVGSHVAEVLLARGERVIGLDNFITGSRKTVGELSCFDSFEFVECDVCEPPALPAELKGVLHLASPASPVHFRTLPMEILRAGSVGTIQMLELAVAAGARFVLASSSEVYGDPLVHPQHEGYTGNVELSGERACYDESKRFSEAAVDTYLRTRDLSAGVARIFNTYGPRINPDDGRVVPNFVSQALAGEPLTVYGDGTQTRSYCFVGDMAHGLVSLLDSGEDLVVNLGNPEEHTVLYLANRIIEMTGSDSGIEHRPLPENDPVRRRPDITRATEILGWVPEVDLERGLKTTIEYFSLARGERRMSLGAMSAEAPRDDHGP